MATENRIFVGCRFVGCSSTGLRSRDSPLARLYVLYAAKIQWARRRAVHSTVLVLYFNSMPMQEIVNAGTHVDSGSNIPNRQLDPARVRTRQEWVRSFPQNRGNWRHKEDKRVVFRSPDEGAKINHSTHDDRCRIRGVA